MRIVFVPSWLAASSLAIALATAASFPQWPAFLALGAFWAGLALALRLAEEG